VDLSARTGPARDVAYAGGLATDYIDWEVLHAVITKHPEITFHFYGPYDLDWPAPRLGETLTLPNVRLHGLVDRPSLIKALRTADLLLLCYRAGDLKHVVANSHKLLEYLSTGVPVVASYTAEMAGPNDLILMARERSGFAALFDRAVHDLEALGSTDLRRARMEQAAERTASRRLQFIAELIARA
jgi:glycosyltransferase involved in cell wall biosynthesis